MNLFRLALVALASFCAFGQQASPSGTVALPFDGPPKEFYSKYFYSSGNDQYICMSSAIQTRIYTLTLTSTVAASTTSLVFSAGHGIHADATPLITVTGGTGAWAALNGTHKAAVTNSTTLTVNVDSSGFGPVAGTLVITSQAPRLTEPVWAVLRVRTVSSATTSVIWASSGWTSICANYATLAYQ